MTGGADDIAKIIDRLMGRVDRLENRGESETQIDVIEDVELDLVIEVSTRVQIKDVTNFHWGDGSAYWGVVTWGDSV